MYNTGDAAIRACGRGSGVSRQVYNIRLKILDAHAVRLAGIRRRGNAETVGVLERALDAGAGRLLAGVGEGLRGALDDAWIGGLSISDHAGLMDLLV